MGITKQTHEHFYGDGELSVRYEYYWDVNLKHKIYHGKHESLYRDGGFIHRYTFKHDRVIGLCLENSNKLW